VGIVVVVLSLILLMGMTTMNEKKVINCYTTPKRLRQIADEMEQEYEQSMVGDKLDKYIIGCSKETEVYLRINQEAVD
jgi:hypothetical protein